MAEKQLNAWVVLGGKVDNSFSALGQSLVNLGSHIDGISQKLINFGKESIQTYRNYEDSMLEAQVALSTNYGRGTKALGEVMDALDKQASEWAATTIFHTDDVANAIAEAAHANWDLDKILEGMPAAMRLAQAGSLDLSTGLDYIIKSTNAAGIEFGDLMEWVDEWTYAANSSAGDVEQFGEAMLRMGATMKFADNKEELLTMLAVLHDAGTTGSNAGTLLRNSMIRLIAPTKKASDAIAELGISESEVEEALAEVDGNTAEAVRRLEEAGFSAYNSKGELKDFTEIFEDLNAATRRMTDEEKYDIWSAIFPTRTITGAMALIEAADNNWNGLLDDLEKGKAAGYGDYAAETMMSGLTGSIETFNSKTEDLRKELGEQLAPQLETVLGNMNKLIDRIRAGGADNGVSSGLDWLTGISEIIGDTAESLGDMDPALFDSLVAGLGGVAALGPMLVMGGLAIRGIGTALSVFTGSPVGNILLVAAGLSVIMTALEKYNEAKFLDKFGSLNIDTTNLDQSMERIKSAFEKAKEPTQGFADALKASVENYNEASTKFSATMMEDLLADQTLTGKKLEEKLEEYRGLGSSMVGALKEGITASADMSAEFWAMVIKGQNGTDEELEKNELYSGILKALNDEKSEALGQAEAIGDQLQKAITKAWEDGNLDEGEREKIKEYFRQLNEAMVEAQREAQSEADFVKRRQMMDKAQGMSYSQMRDYVNETINPQRQAELNWMDESYKSELYTMEYRRDEAQRKYNELMSQGRFDEARKYGERISLYNSNIAGVQGAYEQARAGIYSNYDNLIMSWYAATLGDSDLRGGIPALQQAAAWLMSGQVTDISALSDYIGKNGANISGLQEYYEQEIAALGGMDEIKRRIAAYSESDDTEMQAMADNLEGVLSMYSIVMNNLDALSGLVNYRDNTAEDFEALFREGFFGEKVNEYLKMLTSGEYDSGILREQLGGIDGLIAGYLNGMIASFGDQYNMNMIADQLGAGELSDDLRDDFAMAMLLGMSESEREKYRLGGAESDLWNAEQDAARKRAKADAEVDEYYNHWFSGSYHQGMDLPTNVAADVEAAEAAEALANELRGATEAAETNQETQRELAGQSPFVSMENIAAAYAQAQQLAMQLSEAERQAGLEANLSDAEARLAQAKEATAAAQEAFETEKERLTVGPNHIAGTEAEIKNLEDLKINLDMAEEAQAEAQAAYDAAQEAFNTPIEGSEDLHGAEAGLTARQQAESFFQTPIQGSVILSMLGGLFGFPKKAKGGRETKPSIFAEAGKPEWYIPEEHTHNTAQLLLAAAANSGFTLNDLAEMTGAKLFAEGGTDGGSTGESLNWGSLGNGGNGGDIIVQYSPVIHSDNANGLEEKLKEDKVRFRKFFMEFMAERDMYRSMTAYT